MTESMASEPAEPTEIEIRKSPPGFYDEEPCLAVRFPSQSHWHLVRASRIGAAVGLGSELEKRIADWQPLADPAETTELEELQARIEEHEDLLATIWLYVKWRYVTKQLTTEQKNLWADAVEKVSERHHPGEGAEADRWWQDDRPVRAALVGDQPTAEEPYRCPTLCDDDCESPCHEAHAIPRKRQHDVADCEARQPLSGEALRDAEERDDAARDLP